MKIKTGKKNRKNKKNEKIIKVLEELQELENSLVRILETLVKNIYMFKHNFIIL